LARVKNLIKFSLGINFGVKKIIVENIGASEVAE
jgi:hypothetical protein